ncbi:MAG: DMT family transporter [Dehalococcoidia bacterium]|nr:DMT family transporter [Dehalococcoidia bacterium]
MLGDLAALASAFSWAATSVMLARLGTRYPAPVLSALRMLLATPLVLAVLFATGGAADLGRAGAVAVAAMVMSGLVGYGLGDTTYIRSLRHVGLQRMVPTTTAVWVALSAAGAIVLLDEPLGWSLLAGTVLVIGGTYLIVGDATGALGDTVSGPRWSARLATLAVVGVATCWTVATLLVAGARADLDATAIAAIRLPAGGLTVAAVSIATTRGTVLRSLPRGRDLLATLGIATFGTGLGSWLYLFAVTEAGAARAVVLNSTAPLMALPLAMLFLHERATRRIAAGTVLCLAGTFAVLAG